MNDQQERLTMREIRRATARRQGAARSSHISPPPPDASGFTLIEIMIVVAIIGLIAAMGVPSILQIMRKDGMRKAVSDVMEACGDARARAILSGHTTEVVFHPAQNEFQVADAPGDAPQAPLSGAPGNDFGSTPFRASAAPPKGPVTLPPGVDITMLDINMQDYLESPVARVFFYPNGTCDELTLVLHGGDAWQKITLEFSTALATSSPVTQ
jgi:prepilin-type N-terminal cleavage/methylation domain-containing protein